MDFQASAPANSAVEAVAVVAASSVVTTHSGPWTFAWSTGCTVLADKLGAPLWNSLMDLLQK